MVKTNKGFTLIELLVVIAIIGLLSSVVLASLNTARTKARDARRVADLKQIQTALELYYDTNRTYPVVAAQAIGSSLNAALVPTYIPVVPTDPGSNAYWYAGTANSFCLAADMENTPPPGAPATGTCAGLTGDYRVAP